MAATHVNAKIRRRDYSWHHIQPQDKFQPKGVILSKTVRLLSGRGIFGARGGFYSSRESSDKDWRLLCAKQDETSEFKKESPLSLVTMGGATSSRTNTGGTEGMFQG